MDDNDRMAEIQRYLKENPSVRDTPGGVHLHFHNSPVIQDPQPVNQNPGMNVLEKYAPYIFLGVLSCIPVAGLAFAVTLFIPVMATLMVMVAGILLALAVCIIAVGALVKNLKEPSSKGKRK